MIAPGAGEFVDPGLGAVAVVGDQRDADRSVRRNSAISRRERKQRQQPCASAIGADRRLAALHPAQCRAPSSNCSSASAAASHSAARPASAITQRLGDRVLRCRSAAACSARHAWRGYCRRRRCRRSHPPFGDHPAAFAEQVGRRCRDSHRHSRLAVADDEADGDAVGDRASASPSRPCRRAASAWPGAALPAAMSRRRVEIGRAVLEAPHREQHRAEHAASASDDQHQPLMLGLDHHGSRFSASASASAVRIERQAQATSASGRRATVSA